MDVVVVLFFVFSFVFIVFFFLKSLFFPSFVDPSPIVSAGSSETSTDSGVKVDIKGAANMPSIPTQITIQDDKGRPAELQNR